MNIENTPTVKETSKITARITQLARELIRKHPGIYKGNLEYWIYIRFPEAKKIEIELAFIQLRRERYSFTYTNTVYPPNKADPDLNILSRFICHQKLSDSDYGILYELHRKGPMVLSNLSRRVVSQCWSDDEKEIKIQIQELISAKYIFNHDGRLQVNWTLIKDGVG